MNYFNITLFLVCILIGRYTIPVFYSILQSSNCISKNYKNEEIPIGMGLSIVFLQTLVVLTTAMFIKISLIYPVTYILCTLLIAFVGFIDDIIGEKSIKGLKGHISSLLKGKLTTGGLKAIVGVLTATFFSIVITKNLWEVLVNIIIIALFTNLINLFDLRPGRSIKVFIIFSVFLSISSLTSKMDYVIASILGIITAYLPLDIKGKVMMGDTGSNALGLTLGCYCSYTQSLNTKLIYMVILIMLHIISEFYSFSKLISNNKFLRYIDKLGR